MLKVLIRYMNNAGILICSSSVDSPVFDLWIRIINLLFLLAPGVRGSDVLKGEVLVVLWCLPNNVRTGVFGEFRGCTNEHPSLRNCSSLFVRERKCERSLKDFLSKHSHSSVHVLIIARNWFANGAVSAPGVCELCDGFRTVLNRRCGVVSAPGVLRFVRL